LQRYFQALIILVAFEIIGSATVYAKKAAFNLIQITSETELWIKIPIYIVTILGIYNLLLLSIDFLFG
jgi:ferrochelatase